MSFRYWCRVLGGEKGARRTGKDRNLALKSTEEVGQGSRSFVEMCSEFSVTNQGEEDGAKQTAGESSDDADLEEDNV